MSDYGWYGKAHHDNEKETPRTETVYDRVIRGIHARAHREAMKNHGLMTENPYKREDYALVWEYAFDEVYQNFRKDEIERREMEYWADEIPF